MRFSPFRNAELEKKKLNKLYAVLHAASRIRTYAIKDNISSAFGVLGGVVRGFIFALCAL